MDNGARQRYLYKLQQQELAANRVAAKKSIEAQQLAANNAETQSLAARHNAPPPVAPPALTYVPVLRRDGNAQRQYLAQTMPGPGQAPNAGEGLNKLSAGSINNNQDPAQRAQLKKQNQGKTLPVAAGGGAGGGQGNRGVKDVSKEVRVVASSTGGPARYESTVVAQSDTAVRKTLFPANNQEMPAELTKNVLHGYRSQTYTFTLSGLASSVFSGPVTTDDYRQKSQGLMILSSAGKGSSQIIPGKTSVENKKILNPESIYTGAKPIMEGNNSEKLINSFNKSSPGRFDMFIDNVEIDSLFAFNKNSTVTLPTSLRFEVYEPYGINGFVEALHVAAVAAGYVNYAEACFLLTMKFSGYPDGPGLPEVETEITNATKYFPIKITGFQVDLTERGSRYTCTAIPYSDDGLIDSENRLKQNLQVKGVTVNDILTNFLRDLTEQRKESDRAIRKAAPPDYDEFKLEFISPTSSSQAQSNYLKHSEFTEYGKESQIFVFNNPQTVTGKTGYDGKAKAVAGATANGPASDPKSSAINFAADTNVTDCITAVITGSNWHRDLLKTLTDANRIDDFGMVNYFAIRLEVTNKPTINELKNRPFQIYTYVVTNYKIHYTRIPNYEGKPFDWSKVDLSRIAYRKYNYLFMGQNVDVINFKIHFDNLYFEAVARAMGNSDALQSKNTLAYPTNPEPAQTDNKKRIDRLTKEESPVLPNVPKKEMLPDSRDPTATQPQWADPYYNLSKSMYQAVINSNTAMVKGEIEILGDPFFLTMGGFNNYRPESAGYGVSKDGSVDLFQGQVFIQIKFRNPEDIKAFADGGTAKFSEKPVSFNGIYMVTKVKSTFKNGVFKQILQMLRMNQAEKPESTSNTPEALVSGIGREKYIPDDNKDATVLSEGGA